MATNAVSPLIGGVRKKRKANTSVVVPKKRRRSPKMANTIVRRKKRKVSGISQELPKAAEMVVAAAAGGFIGRIILKTGMLAPANSTATDYRPYLGVVVGIGAMAMLKNPMAKSAGLGCAAVSSMGLIPDKDVPQIGAVRMIGASQTIQLPNRPAINKPRLIAGNTTPAMVGSRPIQGYRNAGGIGG